MPRHMSYCHRLIRTVRRDAGLTLKQVEFQTHYAISTINGWEMQRGTVDPDYMARLYQITGDLRLGQFIVPELHRRQQAAPRKAPIIPLNKANEVLLEAIQDLARSGLQLQRVLADGKVDASDDDHLMEHDSLANKAISAICSLRESIAAHRSGGGNHE